MEQPPEGQEQSGSNADPNHDAIAQAIAAIKQKHYDDRETKQKHIGRRIKQGALCFWRYLKKLFKAGPDRHIELLLTIAIAWFAYAQWSTAKTNNEATGAQINRLIRAADGVKDAAASFSTSAKDINTGIVDAVTQLQQQANNGKSQLRLSADQFQASQRPWLSLTYNQPYLAMGTHGAQLVADFRTKNVGFSVATNITYRSFTVEAERETGLECNYPVATKPSPNQNGTVAFPNEFITGLHAATNEIVYIPNASSPAPLNMKYIQCVVYKSTVDKGLLHHTKRAYTILDENGNPFTRERTGNPIKVQLSLVPDDATAD